MKRAYLYTLWPKGERGPSTAAMTARQVWLAWHRAMRIIRREQAKAMKDMMIFGTGALRTNARTGEVQYVPIEEIRAADLLSSSTKHIYLTTPAAGAYGRSPAR